MAEGHFIVLEGGEGAGKSTLLAMLAAWVRTTLGSPVLCVREPGSTPLGERLRMLLKHPLPQEQPCPMAELLLLYAARSQLVETKIRPCLEAGGIVLGDRHALSTLAYQGAGRRLPRAALEQLHHAVLGDFRPQLTLLLDIDPQVGLQRAARRGMPDRFEAEQLQFYQRVRAAYLEAAQHDPAIRVIDASAGLAEVQAAALGVVEEYFKQSAAGAGSGPGS